MAPRFSATLGLLMFAAAACSSTPPPEPPPPPPPPPPKVEAPPPPKCEKLAEGCKAEASTRARIGASPLVFSPVPGWVYAQGEGTTVAQDGETGPATVMALYPADADAKKELAARDAALAEIAKEMNLTLPKGKIPWKTPTCKCTAAGCSGAVQENCKPLKPLQGMASGIWQLDGAVRAGKKGPLLLVQAPLPQGKALLVVGFVPEDDQAKSDEAIMRSVESVGLAAPPGGGEK